MDRITRALELARAQGGQSPGLKDRPIGSVRSPLDKRPEPPGRDESGLETTATRFAPVVELDRDYLAKENVLPPNAGGPQGGAYKLLRTQVLQRMDQLGANTLAVMSPAAGHGNTLTAINLAIAIAAEHGRTALLVDLNLRDPAVHRRLGFEPAAGVEDSLRGTQPVEHVIVRVADYERLAVMPAREPVEHSSELLSSQRAAALMEELRSRYNNRIMVFDLPPVLSTDDALAFSRVVQTGLVVVSDENTRGDDLRRCLALLGDLPIIGTVLNGARDTGRKRR